MRRILIAISIFLITFLIALFMNLPKKAIAAYLFDSHVIAGGLSGSDGIPIKVDSNGVLYLR